jgi:hypothetical protein
MEAVETPLFFPQTNLLTNVWECTILIVEIEH